MTIEELFGTLQMSVVAGWRKHLKSAKYGKHIALQEFYEGMPDKVDALIEAWMGAHGKKVGSFQNVLSSSNLNTLKYLQELKKVCKQGYDLLGENEELEGLLDDIVNLINSTLYKVKELSEGQMIDLKDFVLEALSDNETNEALNEGRNEYPYDEKHFNAKDCLTWLLKTKALKHYDGNIDADKWAEMAQAAAEDAGLPLDAAEKVYDAAYYAAN